MQRTRDMWGPLLPNLSCPAGNFFKAHCGTVESPLYQCTLAELDPRFRVLGLGLKVKDLRLKD